MSDHRDDDEEGRDAPKAPRLSLLSGDDTARAPRVLREPRLARPISRQDGPEGEAAPRPIQRLSAPPRGGAFGSPQTPPLRREPSAPKPPPTTAPQTPPVDRYSDLPEPPRPRVPDPTALRPEPPLPSEDVPRAPERPVARAPRPEPPLPNEPAATAPLPARPRAPTTAAPTTRPPLDEDAEAVAERRAEERRQQRERREASPPPRPENAPPRAPTETRERPAPAPTPKPVPTRQETSPAEPVPLHPTARAKPPEPAPQTRAEAPAKPQAPKPVPEAIEPPPPPPPPSPAPTPASVAKPATRPTPVLVTDNEGLKVHSLGKQFKKRPVLRDVSLRVQRGEAVGLLGPNGAGKTTCFYIVTGLIPTDYGQIELDGVDITELPMYRRSRLGIGYLPQESSIFRGLTVEQNIIAVLELIEKNREKREAALEALLAEFSITHLRRTPAIALSGGERRRLEIARALASQPNFVLLDEPLAGIDPIAVRDIRELVSHLKDRGIGVLITDHNVRETLDIVDRAYILHDGRVLMEGTPDEIVENQEVRRVYLGDRFSL